MVRIFNHYCNINVLMQMVADFLFVLLAMVVLGSVFLRDSVPVATTATHGLSLATWSFVVGSATGMYQSGSTQSLQRSVTRALIAAVLMLPLAYGIFSVLPSELTGAPLMPYAAMLTVLGVIAHRSIAVHFTRLPAMQSRVLVVGTGPAALQVSESLAAADPHARVVGYFPSPSDRDCAVPSAKVLSGDLSLAATARRAAIDEVIVAVAERRSGSMPMRDLLDCKIGGIRVSDLSTHFERRLGQIRLDHVNAGWLIFGDGFNQGVLRTAIKRVFDLLCASLLFVLTAPLMLLTMVLIKLESPGPVFYRQERVGLNGRTFHVIKFRSMRTDAEKDGKPRWASAVDDRITRVGNFIRRVRIDELPQLVNVIKGEMSLVGPRPERPYFVESLTQQIPYYAIRHSVKPGVTGWAQVRYEYGSTVEDAKQKLQYDLYYVKNHTLFLDMLVMFETVSVVLTGKGAR